MGTKWPKAVAKIGDDLDALTACHDYRPSTGSTFTHQPDRVDLATSGTGRHVGQRELRVRFGWLKVGSMVGLRHAGWAGR